MSPAGQAPPLRRVRRFSRRPGGPRIYYEVGGSPQGVPVVLIRGLARSSSYWLELRELLERRRRVIVLDNRGVGRSDTPPGRWTTAQMADDVAAVLADCAAGGGPGRAAERADVFGISLGGMIAQQLAVRHPGRVRRLALACTSPGGRNARPLAPSALLALARSATMPFDQGIRHSAPWVLSPEYIARRPETVELWIAIAHSEPRSRLGLAGQLLAAARHDAWELLSAVEHETLVVTGGADRLVHVDNSRLLAQRLPNASLRVLERAPHDFPTERPHETAALLSTFFG